MSNSLQKLIRTRYLVRTLCLFVALSFVAQAARAQDAIEPPTQETLKAPANPTFPATAPQEATSLGESADLAQFLFGKNNFPDTAYDQLQAWKEEYHLPISIGANHWFNIDRDEHVYGRGYGIPGIRGTYYYYIGADPSFKLDDGWLQEVGAHAQFRFRDVNEKVRAYYYDTYWFYEAYGYAKTSFGEFKAGEVVMQFGIPWDGTWWESIPYFDGYKFNPDYGVSWENTWKLSDRLTVDSAAQFFIASSKVSGALLNADAESTIGLNERNKGVVRVAPTWTFNKDLKLQWGVSGLVGQIGGARDGVVDSSHSAFGTDATLTWKDASIFGEYIDGFGVTTPARYVSGGPSDRVDSIRGGISYKYGPATFHVVYSRGWDHNPNGHEYTIDPGFSLQLTKNVVEYVEYVKWDVVNQKGHTTPYADGFELITVWNL